MQSMYRPTTLEFYIYSSQTMISRFRTTFTQVSKGSIVDLDTTVGNTNASSSVQRDCHYRINLAGADDVESHYHIWEAMVALNELCVKQRKSGIAYDLGSSHPPSRGP